MERRNIHTGTTHATSKFTCETVNFYNQALKVDFLTRKLLKKMQMIHDTKSRAAQRTLRKKNPFGNSSCNLTHGLRAHDG